MSQPCKSCQTPFTNSAEDLAFLQQFSPIFNGKKYDLPPPDHCPDCRQQRRLVFCNERNLYPGTCDMCEAKAECRAGCATKKRILTEHPPHAKQPNYCRDCWVSEKWDTRDYGQDFDFSRPFFEQFHELMRRVPMMALNTSGTIQNSDYIHYAGYCKNCYLIAHADYCEDCLYGYGFKQNKCCVDGFYNLHDELCYDCVDCHKSYGLKGCQDCQNCHSSAFLRDCTGCKNCFLCVGLKGKEYYFENEKLSREQYESKLSQIDLGSYSQYQKSKLRLRELEKPHHFKEYQGFNLQNSTGNYLYNCKDCHNCFDCEDVESARYCTQLVLGSKNNMDIYQFGTGLQQSYNSTICGHDSYHILFSHEIFVNSVDMYYCTHAHTSKNCFGSTCTNHHQFLILNKQYTEAEYNALVPKIIEHMQKTGEWGHYFPIKSSLFGYNKTTAQLWYPLTKPEALAKGYTWDDYEPPIPDITKKIAAAKIPDNIDKIPDEILNWAIQCEATGRLFKITPAELKFYRTQRLPIPHRSPDQRHLDRFNLRNPRKFWSRKCEKCAKDLQTTHSPETGKSVYCDKCYLEATY